MRVCSVFEELCDFQGCVFLEMRRDVAVDVEGYGHGGVSEAVLDDLGRDSSLKRQRGPSVAEVVQPDRGDASDSDLRFEGSAHPLGVVWPTVGAREDEVIDLWIGRAPDDVPIPRANLLLGAENGDGRRIEGNGASSRRCLGVGPDGSVVVGVDDVDECSDDRDPSGLEVDVGPCQAKRLASAEARSCEQVPQGVFARAASGIEEGRELASGPRLAGGVAGGGRRKAWRLGLVRGIVVEQPVLDGRLEDAADDGVDVAHGADAEPAVTVVDLRAVGQAVIEQLRVQRSELAPGDPLQGGVAQGREHVDPKVALVRVQRRGA